MPKIDKVTESKTGDGDTRVTTTYTNGTSRDVTYTSSGVKVDDHAPDGSTKSGDGGKDLLTGEWHRINTK